MSYRDLISVRANDSNVFLNIFVYALASFFQSAQFCSC